MVFIKPNCNFYYRSPTKCIISFIYTDFFRIWEMCDHHIGILMCRTVIVIFCGCCSCFDWSIIILFSFIQPFGCRFSLLLLLFFFRCLRTAFSTLILAYLYRKIWKLGSIAAFNFRNSTIYSSAGCYQPHYFHSTPTTTTTKPFTHTHTHNDLTWFNLMWLRLNCIFQKLYQLNLLLFIHLIELSNNLCRRICVKRVQIYDRARGILT